MCVFVLCVWRKRQGEKNADISYSRFLSFFETKITVLERINLDQGCRKYGKRNKQDSGSVSEGIIITEFDWQERVGTRSRAAFYISLNRRSEIFPTLNPYYLYFF